MYLQLNTNQTFFSLDYWLSLYRLVHEGRSGPDV